VSDDMAPPPKSNPYESNAAELRTEIREAQQTTYDLLKWKLAIVAAVGAAALGIGDKTERNFEALLALLPGVCVYVDAICYQIDRRIYVLGAFLKDRKNSYELWVHSNLDSFGSEALALAASTGTVCVSVSLYGRLVAALDIRFLLMFTGMCGLALAIAVRLHHFERSKARYKDSPKPESRIVVDILVVALLVLMAVTILTMLSP